MKYNLRNLTDILRTKTYIINKYENNENHIYFDGKSYEEVTYTLDEKNDPIILTTVFNNTKVIYNIYKNIKNSFHIEEENIYPEPIIMLDNVSAYKKIINMFTNELLATHYPTLLNQDKISIHYVDEGVGIDNLKPSLDSSVIEYKIFYHPIYMKDLKYLAYIKNDMSTLKSEDFRKCKPATIYV
ncbi:unknown similar to AMEV145 [Mythimna separata entomopoxvirus 'L']|uniref:Uncharacterized protein n=1 Tax=Mythimna separata entomopoxvirus 'L' TaxID=1293572 RepID=A0A916KQA0_9POXV|nr:unknown similar to AMEV145 [Mythimna separata entomopoxvirus 'L']CCU56383.1 unknown similar to AMEV145 [Mythimna separata entomopoxvirus 'L']